MGFLKSLKEKVSHARDNDTNRQAYAESSDSDIKHSQKYMSFDTKDNSPLSPFHDQSPSSETYAPPPGPPPQLSSQEASSSNPPPYESWLSVPDTSSFPPPPALQNEHSVANNATFSSAERAHKWCAAHPVYTPTIPRSATLVESSQAGQLGLEAPPDGGRFKGKITNLGPTAWEIQTDKSQQDTTLTSTLPIYFAATSNPLLQPPSASKQPVTFAFSISIHHLRRDAGVAIGFTSKPYPPFRLPGWHRASQAVHSDDGNRYVNDPHGGVDFMSPFHSGDTIRLSMTVHPRLSPVQVYRGKYRDQKPVEGGLPKCEVRCEVMRNGKLEGSWDVHEERDAERDEGVEGLQGEADMYCAIGVFGEVHAVVRYEAAE